MNYNELSERVHCKYKRSFEPACKLRGKTFSFKVKRVNSPIWLPYISVHLGAYKEDYGTFCGCMKRRHMHIVATVFLELTTSLLRKSYVTLTTFCPSIMMHGLNAPGLNSWVMRQGQNDPWRKVFDRALTIIDQRWSKLSCKSHFITLFYSSFRLIKCYQWMLLISKPDLPRPTFQRQTKWDLDSRLGCYITLYKTISWFIFTFSSTLLLATS